MKMVFCQDADGLVSQDECANAFEGLGLKLKEDEIRKLFEESKALKDGLLPYDGLFQFFLF